MGRTDTDKEWPHVNHGKSIRVNFLFPPKNSGWTKQFLGPPPPPSPALYTVHAWAPQKAPVVHSSCGVASVWSAHLQPPPATSSHLQVSTLQTSLNIRSRVLPCAGSCIFSGHCRCVMCLADPGPGLAGLATLITRSGHSARNNYHG